LLQRFYNLTFHPDVNKTNWMSYTLLVQLHLAIFAKYFWNNLFLVPLKYSGAVKKWLKVHVVSKDKMKRLSSMWIFSKTCNLKKYYFLSLKELSCVGFIDDCSMTSNDFIWCSTLWHHTRSTWTTKAHLNQCCEKRWAQPTIPNPILKTSNSSIDARIRFSAGTHTLEISTSTRKRSIRRFDCSSSFCCPFTFL